MAIVYILTPDLRSRLKEPIGTLIHGPACQTMKIMKEIVKKENPTMIISVGDVVSKNLDESNISPKLFIVDNKVMRTRIDPIALRTNKTFHVENPPGTMTEEALLAIQEAVRKDYRVRIVVEGEEDLLTLAAVLYAPENSLVIYGQPFEGVVVVKVTKQKRAEITEILKTMEDFREKLNREKTHQVDSIPEEKP